MSRKCAIAAPVIPAPTLYNASASRTHQSMARVHDDVGPVGERIVTTMINKLIGGTAVVGAPVGRGGRREGDGKPWRWEALAIVEGAGVGRRQHQRGQYFLHPGNRVTSASSGLHMSHYALLYQRGWNASALHTTATTLRDHVVQWIYLYTHHGCLAYHDLFPASGWRIRISLKFRW